jgi:hypothetical protein
MGERGVRKIPLQNGEYGLRMVSRITYEILIRNPPAPSVGGQSPIRQSGEPVHLRGGVVHDLAPLLVRQTTEPFGDDLLRPWECRGGMWIV